MLDRNKSTIPLISLVFVPLIKNLKQYQVVLKVHNTFVPQLSVIVFMCYQGALDGSDLPQVRKLASQEGLQNWHHNDNNVKMCVCLQIHKNGAEFFGVFSIRKSRHMSVINKMLIVMDRGLCNFFVLH